VRLRSRSLSRRPHFKSYIDHAAIAHAICKAQGETKSEELETGLPVTTLRRFRKNELKRSHHFDSSQNFATSLPALAFGHRAALRASPTHRRQSKSLRARSWLPHCKRPPVIFNHQYNPCGRIGQQHWKPNRPGNVFARCIAPPVLRDTIWDTGPSGIPRASSKPDLGSSLARARNSGHSPLSPIRLRLPSAAKSRRTPEPECRGSHEPSGCVPR